MFYWSFTSLVHFWPPSIFNPGYAYGSDFRQSSYLTSLDRRSFVLSRPTWTSISCVISALQLAPRRNGGS